MILIKDYASMKRSFTITGLVVTFVLSISAIIYSFFSPFNPEILWGSLAMHFSYVGLYWNKRVRADRMEVEK